MAERLSRSDETFLYGYEMHAQRYRFAARWCDGKQILDAGCGIGYGSALLARSGAAQVVGVDISPEALAEAQRHYRGDRVRFARADLHALGEAPDVPVEVDLIVNLENIEHLPRPEAFLSEAVRRLRPGGRFITSTPNGKLTVLDGQGRNENPFHVKEFTREEFVLLLSPHFSEVELHGQWETHDRKLRLLESRRAFEQICEAYYNPMARVGRLVKRLLGRKTAPPPVYGAEGAAYSWEHVIAPLDEPPYEWEPAVILAVCTR